MLHAGQADRGKGHGHGDVLTDHLCLGGAPAHVYSDALAQPDFVEIRCVFAESLFGPAARFGIIIEHARHATFVQALEVLDIRDYGHQRASSRIGQII